jgi:hypothetical protein
VSRARSRSRALAVAAIRRTARQRARDRSRRNREDRLITIAGEVYERPGPSFADRWLPYRTKARATAGVEIDDD